MAWKVSPEVQTPIRRQLYLKLSNLAKIADMYLCWGESFLYNILCSGLRKSQIGIPVDDSLYHLYKVIGKSYYIASGLNTTNILWTIQLSIFLGIINTGVSYWYLCTSISTLISTRYTISFWNVSFLIYDTWYYL